MGKRRLDFSDVRPVAPEAAGAIDSLRVTITTKARTSHTLDFTALPGTPLMRRMVAAMELWLRSCRWANASVLAPGNKVTVFTAMLRLLHERGLRYVHEIDVAAHDAVEEWLFSTYSDKVARGRLRWLQEPLRHLGDDEKHPALAARLVYLTQRPEEKKSTPRDAYSARVRSALRKACLADMHAVVTRLATDADRVLRDACDPRSEASPVEANSAVARRHPGRPYLVRLRRARPGDDRARGWLSPKHVAWELAERGPISYDTLSALSGYHTRHLSNAAVLRDAVRMVFPTRADLIPFQLYLQLRTGLPPWSCIGLTTDCLEETGPARANLRYYKGRAKRTIVTNVGTETLASAGGAIKAVLAITARLRRHVAPENQNKLWLDVNPTSYHDVRANQISHQFVYDEFIRRHRLTDDDGTPLRITQARLRKSYKADVAEATGGRLDAIAADNSPEVAAKHYGNIPALRPLHEQTVEDAAHDALAAALQITVVTPEDEAALAVPQREAREQGIKASRVLAVIQRPEEHDVFLSGCLDFFDSPYAKRAGDPCPVATWRCLECLNAVVTSRHLPRLLRFADHLLREHDHLGEEVWRLKYGQAHEVLHAGIFCRFPDAALAAARAIASADDDLRWLPPELRTSLLTSPSPSKEPAA